MRRLFLYLFFSSSLQAFKLGVENISDELFRRLQTLSVGLLTNQTGKDQSGRRTIELLAEKGLEVKVVYVPEHGYDGLVKAAKEVEDGNASARVPIISLYGKGTGKIAPGMFDAVDVILVDLQDAGMRHYTYISTLYTVMQQVASLGKELVVLDRPNLLGAVMEGPVCLSQLRSFIGIAEIPLRHGMTIGELAQFFNKQLTPRMKLTVVPMREYCRDRLATDLLAHLSPNIASMPSLHGYSFLGLLGEVRPFYVGVGTSDAFQLLMLPRFLGVPEKAWLSLQQELAKRGIASSSHMFCRGKKEYEGLRLSFVNMNEVSSFKAFMSVLAWAKEQVVPIQFAQTFDKAVGTPCVRTWYEENGEREPLLQAVKDEVQRFLDANRDVLLYADDPKVVYKGSAIGCDRV